jgi:hypothetical protein
MLIISFSTMTAEAISIESRDSIQFGIKPLFGVNFGEFWNKYSYAYGFQFFGRGLYQLSLPDGHKIYPEVKIGWMILPHNTDSGRMTNMMPINFNFIWDWHFLRFSTRFGQFQIKPYIGFGIYSISYQIKGKSTSSLDGGYEIGVNLEFYHPKMEDFHLEFGIEHNYINEIDTNLFQIIFTFGAGYTYYTDSRKQTDSQTALIRAQYLEDLMTDDEHKINPAAIWLGKNREKTVTNRLMYLLKNDKRYRVRQNAAFGLGLMEDPALIDPLYQAFISDQDSDVKYICLMSISRIGPTKEIMKNLKEIKKDTKDPHIKDYIEKMEKMFK